MPGGGGLGDAFTRPPADVAEDVRLGLISLVAACRDYGVALNDDFSVDAAATSVLRTYRSDATSHHASADGAAQRSST
jgi:N-methylhydantoinase B